MVKITLRNYRGFTSESPASFTLGDGFTAFVGKNNAGKSTCLRAIFELRNLLGDVSKWVGIDQSYTQIQCPTEPDPTVLLNFDNNSPAFITVEIEPSLEIVRDQIIQSTIRIERDGRAILNSIKLSGPEGTTEIKAPIAYQRSVQFENPNEPYAEIQNSHGHSFTYSYLNFVSALQLLARSGYYGAYRNAINEGAGQYYDIAVGTNLITQWDQWKVGLSNANQRAIARVEADIERLLGYKSLEINASADNKTLMVKVNKHPFKLADLGAGVAELIITLSNALVHKPSFILIDEPESHLHPSLQVDFLTTLAGYATHGIAFSTHSIGLAKAISDRTYAITHENNTSSCVLYEKQTHIAELLGNLSYSGYIPSKNFYVLLVEGTTEVKTFQMFLRKLKKDHMYAILPLGGSSLTRENSDHELAEVVRIAGGADKVFAIIDSERQTKGASLDNAHQAFDVTCKKLGITLLITERRATENYFRDAAIKNSLKGNFSALSEFGERTEHGNAWAKSDNWRIADSESPDFFKAHDLGEFINNLPTKS